MLWPFWGSVMEVERSSPSPLAQRLLWLGYGALGLFLVAGVVTPTVRRLMARTPSDNPAAAQAGIPPHWSSEQVEELIAAIHDARKVGLEPGDYGLAALKGELARRGGPTLSAGSVQLDRLAEASALNLAEDLSRQAMADHGQIDWYGRDRAHDPHLVGALHAALAQGRLRAWLRSLRPQAGPHAPNR